MWVIFLRKDLSFFFVLKMCIWRIYFLKESFIFSLVKFVDLFKVVKFMFLIVSMFSEGLWVYLSLSEVWILIFIVFYKEID